MDVGELPTMKVDFFWWEVFPPTHQDNYLFEYDKDLNFIQKHSLPTGYTRLGVQTIDYVDNHWWLG